MLRPAQTSQFKRDIKKARKSSKNLEKLETVVKTLLNEKPLPEKHKNHPLIGQWNGFYDCHVEPDWVLIYKIDKNNGLLILTRTGSHSDLFS